MRSIQEIKDQMMLMKGFLLMSLGREDWHACWDASIDLAKLHDTLNFVKEHNDQNSTIGKTRIREE